MSFLALGPHVFSCMPMTLENLSRSTKANWVGIPRFQRQVARQYTGEGEHSIKLKGLLYPSHFGGFLEYEALRITQKAGKPVPLLGLNMGLVGVFYGLVVILDISDTQEYLSPDTGIGQKISFDVEVAPFGDDGILGGFFE